MKIIAVDNFDRDEVSDRHVVFVRSAEAARQVCRLLNDDAGDLSDVVYKVVPNDHKLRIFEP